MACIYCGGQVGPDGICTSCGLNQEYLERAWLTSLHYYNQALTYAKLRNLSAAKTSLKTALHYSRNNVAARNLLGLVYFETGQVGDALTQWVISNSIQPEDNLATEYLRKVQSNQGKLDAYDQAAKKFNLTLHHCKQHNLDLALIQLKRILAINPNYVKAYLVLALICIEQKEYSRARKALEHVRKIDHYNPRMLHYMSEITRLTGKSVSGREESDEDVTSDLGWEPDYNEPEDSEESALRKLKEVVERGAAAEDLGEESDLEISSYKDIKYGKHNLLYMLVGLTVGIVAMFILIIPAKIKNSAKHYDEQIATMQAELSGKNENIYNLEQSVSELQTENERVSTELETLKSQTGGQSTDDILIGAVNSYLAGDKRAALQALSAYDLANAELSDAARQLITTVAAGSEEELESLHTAGVSAYDASNYEEAINNLLIYAHMKPDDVESRYKLAKSYEMTGKVDLAQNLYRDINTRFPDSEYVTTLFQ